MPIGRPKLFSQIDAITLKNKIDNLHIRNYFPDFNEIQEIVEELFQVSITSYSARYICKD